MPVQAASALILIIPQMWPVVTYNHVGCCICRTNDRLCDIVRAADTIPANGIIDVAQLVSKSNVSD